MEDDSNIAQLLQLYLEKEGFETQVAADGGKGVEPVPLPCSPDLVLLDIMLPVMDGWGVLQKDPGDQQDAHHHADRQGRDSRTRSPAWRWGPTTTSSSPSR